MTTELFWLVLTAILAGSMWIPYIIGINITSFEGKDEIFMRPPDMSKMAPWVHRSHRAHLNLLEQLLPFAVIVLASSVLGVSTSVTAWCSILFFWLRVIHAVGMITGIARLPLRPIIYLAGWVVTLVMAWQVIAHAPRLISHT